MKRLTPIVLALFAALLVSAAPAAAKSARIYDGTVSYPVSAGVTCPTDWPGAYVDQTPSRGDPTGRVSINAHTYTATVSISHATPNLTDGYYIYLYDVADCGVTGSYWDTERAVLSTDANGDGSVTFTNFTDLAPGDTAILEVYATAEDWFSTLRIRL